MGEADGGEAAARIGDLEAELDHGSVSSVCEFARRTACFGRVGPFRTLVAACGRGYHDSSQLHEEETMKARIRRSVLRAVALGVAALALDGRRRDGRARCRRCGRGRRDQGVPAQVRRPADPVRRQGMQAVGAGVELERPGPGRPRGDRTARRTARPGRMVILVRAADPAGPAGPVGPAGPPGPGRRDHEDRVARRDRLHDERRNTGTVSVETESTARSSSRARTAAAAAPAASGLGARDQRDRLRPGRRRQRRLRRDLQRRRRALPT